MRLLRLLVRMAALRRVAAILVLAFVGLLHLARILTLWLMLLALTIAMSVALAMTVHLLLLLLLLLLLALMLAARADHAIVVLGMLIEILGGDPVACGARIAGKRQIFLENLIGVAADADIGAAAVEGL